MAPDTLNKIKLALRRKHDKLDVDLRADIEACLLDLQAHGVIYKDDTDPLIYNAVKLWCLSLYSDKGEEYLRRYIALRDSLKVAEGYGWKAGEANV